MLIELYGGKNLEMLRNVFTVLVIVQLSLWKDITREKQDLVTLGLR